MSPTFAKATAGKHLSLLLMLVLVSVALGAPPFATPSYAQGLSQPATANGTRRFHGFDLGGYATVGNISFTAERSFETILHKSSGLIFGGGARLGLPWGGLYLDVGAWHYRDKGERAFLFNNTVVRLGVPVDVAITPLELSAGWRFRIPRLPQLIPYAAAGVTALSYRETSSFTRTGEDVDELFRGYHFLGGVEYKALPWLGWAFETAVTTVPDAIGEAGVSAAFNEHSLGGTTIRFKMTIGR